MMYDGCKVLETGGRCLFPPNIVCFLIFECCVTFILRFLQIVMAPLEHQSDTGSCLKST